MFDLAALNAELAGSIFAGKIHFSAVTDSTNTDALKPRAPARRMARFILPMSSLPAVAAGTTAGISAAGEGLYVSVLLRPKMPASRLHQLPLAAGLAARRSGSHRLQESRSICAGPMIC